LIIITNFLLF
jgi:synaptotagmin-1